MPQPMTEISFNEVQKAIREKIAGILEKNEEDLDVEASFSDLGLSSVKAVEVVADLEDSYDLVLPPTLFYDHPNISSAAGFIARCLADGTEHGGAP